jgi:hypothetical protein
VTADAVPLLHLGRAGGTPPSDDEVLDIAGDGTWTARRTVGGRRVGRFAGSLDGRALAGLRRDVERAAAAGDARVPTPHNGATESFELEGGASLLTGSNEDAPAGWRPLVKRARTFLLEGAIEGPVAALELVADLAAARIVHAGTEPVEVDPASVRVQVARVGSDGARLGDWARGSGDQPGWVTADAGWVLDLPFAHGLDPRPGDVLQVRVELRVRDGGVRRVRLYVPVRATPSA